MKKKHFYAGTILVAFLLVGVKPSAGTIFIPTDTSIGTWDSVNRIYTLTTDVSETIGNAIEIDEDNLTLDGAGHTITGPGGISLGYGVYLSGRTDVTIQNVNVQGFSRGINLNFSSYNTLTGNTASDNNVGINLNISGNNTLTGNTVSNNDYGIYLGGSSSNTLTGNTASSNYQQGIYLYSSSNSILTGNTADWNNSHGIYLDRSSSNTLTRNTVNSNGEQGIYLYYSSNSILTGNTANSNSLTGICLHYYSSYNTLTGNTVNSNSRDGITLRWYSSNNTLTANTASDDWCGFRLYRSSNNTLTGNTTSNDQYGISISYSSNNQIYNNNFIDNVVTQAVVGSACSGNLFNRDKPIGGNYWSDWISPDVLPPPDGDGFVDSPYVFSGGQDNLPWTEMDGWRWPNEPPVADAGPDQTVLVNETVTFDGSGSYDPDGTIVSYAWDFGDGAMAGAVVSHAYAEAGVYVATLTVTDDDGASATDQTTITVQTPAEACGDLIATVESMNLQQGIDNALDAKLEAVVQALDDVNQNNDVAAINALGAFINAVEAQRGDKIPEAYADALIAAVQEIIAALSGV